jgi:hypothetical protein
MLEMSSIRINARSMGMSNHGLQHTFKGPGEVVNGLTVIKNVLVKCLHFQLELNTLGFLSVPTDKNVKD